MVISGVCLCVGFLEHGCIDTPTGTNLPDFTAGETGEGSTSRAEGCSSDASSS